MTAPRVVEAMEEEEVFTPLKEDVVGIVGRSRCWRRRQVWRANFLRLVSWRVAEADQPVVVNVVVWMLVEVVVFVMLSFGCW